MRHNLSLFLALLSCVLTWSCGEFTGPTQRDIPGLYDMETYAGEALPHAISDSVVVVASTMILGGDGSYTETITYRAGTVEFFRFYNGRYSYSFNQVAVTFNDGGGFLLEVADKRTLTENDANGIIVYAKQ